MSNGIKKTPGPVVGQTGIGSDTSVQETPVADKISELRFPDISDLAKTSIAESPSALEGLIASGLEQLAKAADWEGQQNAMGVLMGAMLSTKPAKAKQSGSVSDMLDFKSMLQGLESGTSAPQIASDAKNLAALTTVVLGGGDGNVSVDQLKVDVAEIRGAIADVLQQPKDHAVEGIRAMIGSLTQYAGEISKVQQGNPAVVRMDAFAALMNTVLRYAAPRAGAHA